jgi:hypothetical protein
MPEQFSNYNSRPRGLDPSVIGDYHNPQTPSSHTTHSSERSTFGQDNKKPLGRDPSLISQTMERAHYYSHDNTAASAPAAEEEISYEPDVVVKSNRDGPSELDVYIPPAFQQDRLGSHPQKHSDSQADDEMYFDTVDCGRRGPSTDNKWPFDFITNPASGSEKAKINVGTTDRPMPTTNTASTSTSGARSGGLKVTLATIRKAMPDGTITEVVEKRQYQADGTIIVLSRTTMMKTGSSTKLKQSPPSTPDSFKPSAVTLATKSDPAPTPYVVPPSLPRVVTTTLTKPDQSIVETTVTSQYQADGSYKVISKTTKTRTAVPAHSPALPQQQTYYYPQAQQQYVPLPATMPAVAPPANNQQQVQQNNGNQIPWGKIAYVGVKLGLELLS